MRPFTPAPTPNPRGVMFFLGTFKQWLYNRKRDVFRFHDGTKWRRADPVRVHAELERALPDFASRVADAVRDPRDLPVGPLRDEVAGKKKEATQLLIGASRKAFKLADLDDSKGCTDPEALQVLLKYLLFMEDVAASAQVFTI